VLVRVLVRVLVLVVLVLVMMLGRPRRLPKESGRRV
jgi:hypothetical protein